MKNKAELCRCIQPSLSYTCRHLCAGLAPNLPAAGHGLSPHSPSSNKGGAGQGEDAVLCSSPELGHRQLPAVTHPHHPWGCPQDQPNKTRRFQVFAAKRGLREAGTSPTGGKWVSRAAEENKTFGKALDCASGSTALRCPRSRAPLIGEQPAGELRQGTMAAPRTASTKGSEEETKPQDTKKLLLRSQDPASRSAQLNHISQQETATTQDKPKNPQHLPRRTPSTASLSRVPARHLRVCSVPITATRARHTPQRLAQQARLGELWPEENHLVAFSPSFPSCYSTAELQ